MIYVNEQVLDLNTIKLPNGDYYKGQDEIKSLFAGAWRELDEKFFDKGEKVVFVTPGIKSGAGKGNQGYNYPRVVDYKTRKGNVRIAWADNLVIENGKKIYTPVSRSIGLNEKTLTLTPDDIEEVLFMFLFNAFVITPERPNGRTYLQDREAEAMKYAASEMDAAVISYWLFRKESPMYSNDMKVTTLCLAWGINPDNKTITFKKQLLAEAVKRYEKKNDPEFNLKAFNLVCEKLKDGQDTQEIDIMAMIQKAIHAAVIGYDAEKLSWVLLGMDGNALKTICKVPPQFIDSNRNVLKRHLLGNADDVETIRYSLYTDEPKPSKLDKCVLSVAIPDDVTTEYIENVMNWADKKKIYKYLGHDPQGVTMDQVNPILIEHFVSRRKTIPFDVKK